MLYIFINHDEKLSESILLSLPWMSEVHHGCWIRKLYPFSNHRKSTTKRGNWTISTGVNDWYPISKKLVKIPSKMQKFQSVNIEYPSQSRDVLLTLTSSLYREDVSSTIPLLQLPLPLHVRSRHWSCGGWLQDWLSLVLWRWLSQYGRLRRIFLWRVQHRLWVSFDTWLRGL